MTNKCITIQSLSTRNERGICFRSKTAWIGKADGPVRDSSALGSVHGPQATMQARGGQQRTWKRQMRYWALSSIYHHVVPLIVIVSTTSSSV